MFEQRANGENFLTEVRNAVALLTVLVEQLERQAEEPSNRLAGLTAPGGLRRYYIAATWN
jgi:hypothetical protein